MRKYFYTTSIWIRNKKMLFFVIKSEIKCNFAAKFRMYLKHTKKGYTLYSEI